MNKVLSALLLLLSLAGSAPAQVTAVRAGRVVDPDTGTVQTNQIILMENGRIRAIGPTVQVPAGAQVIDLSSATVSPGLVDAQRGALKAGMAADFIATPGNPLEDIQTLKKVIFVVKNGQIIKAPK